MLDELIQLAVRDGFGLGQGEAGSQPRSAVPPRDRLDRLEGTTRRTLMQGRERRQTKHPDSLLPDLLLARPIRFGHLDRVLDDVDDVSVRAGDFVTVFAGLLISAGQAMTGPRLTVYSKMSPTTLTSSPAGRVVNSWGERWDRRTVGSCGDATVAVLLPKRLNMTPVDSRGGGRWEYRYGGSGGRRGG